MTGPRGMPPSRGEGAILFGGGGFLGPWILERAPAMISAGRTRPPTANRHIPVASLADLSALRDVPFDRAVFIVGHTDHHALEREDLPPGEPTAFDYHLTPLIQTLEQLKGRGLRKFVAFSTILLYDEQRLTLPVSETAPIDPYRNRYVLSKYLAEEAARFYARWVPLVMVRLSNLYGPTPLRRYDLIHVLIRQLLAEGRGRVWSTRPARDFIYVEDVAEAVLELLDGDFLGTLNLGTGVMTPVARIVEILRDLSGCPIEDQGLAVSGPLRFVCDLRTVERALRWRPRVAIEEGLEVTWERMKAWHGR
jgi:nucleoside-diphosphate-sugar epimerase